ncbi:hypothetical protein RJ639_017644 [Escallonia herrerae]|uniref:Retrotransposon gag domain-containing protein n=1 Tax=Escallonia herrerae TaxID=1293975 RepID=A0AA89AL35_9ASTE|nr:hypothetical protein RJ639_017644 [Escallonia herrerae]
MAVAPPSTHHSHLDPSDLRLRLTSRSSYGRKYRSAADPTFDSKEKGGEHMTRSGSCYRRDPSVDDSTNSSPAQAAKAETPQRSIHRKKTHEFRTRERDPWKIVPRDHCPEQSPRGKNLDILYPRPSKRQSYLPIFECLNVSDAVTCRAFPTTLRKAAHPWFKSLQPRSIYSFSQLSDLFQKYFVSSRFRRKNSASLLNVVQEKNEPLACFLGRFNAATLEIDNLDEFVKYIAFLRDLQSTSKFAFSMNKSPPGNMKALLEKANKYIQAEEYLETHRGRREEGNEEQQKRSQELNPQGGKPTKRSKRHPKILFASKNLTPLNAKPSQILHEIKDNKALQWPDKMRSWPNKRNKDLWCHYHNDHGHTTDNYGSLKRAIKALIKRGQLRRFVSWEADAATRLLVVTQLWWLRGFLSFQKYRLEPGPGHYTYVLHRYIRPADWAEELWCLFQDMTEPTAVVRAVLNAKPTRLVRRGEVAAKHLLELEPDRPGIYVAFQFFMQQLARVILFAT